MERVWGAFEKIGRAWEGGEKTSVGAMKRSGGQVRSVFLTLAQTYFLFSSGTSCKSSGLATTRFRQGLISPHFCKSNQQGASCEAIFPDFGWTAPLLTLFLVFGNQQPVTLSN